MLRFLLPLFLCSLFSFVEGAHGDQTKLGVIVPLSGTSATMGESLSGIVKLASLRSIEVRFEDDRCEGKNALSAYHKLRKEGVRIFYLACSGSLLALAPLAKQNGDLLLTTYAGSSRIRSTGDEVIRLNPDATSVAEGLLPLLTPEMLPTVVLYEEQDYADSLTERLSQLLGAGVLETIPYRPDAGTYAAEILRVKQLAAKSIVVVPVSDSAARVLFRQLAQHEFKLPIIGEVNFCDYPFKPSEHGLHGRCIAAKFEGREYDEFLVRYATQNGHPPAYPFYDGMAFDLLVWLEDAAKQGKSTVNDFKAALLKGFDGTFAKYRLTPEGETKGVGEYLVTVNF